MAVYLDPTEVMYTKIGNMPEGVMRNTARDIERAAKSNLAQVRATTEHTKLPEPMVKRQQASGLTDIGIDIIPQGSGKNKYGNDYIVWMTGGEDNLAAMAIEMGHNPSGYFAGKITKPPRQRGQHILTRAAGLTMLLRFG